MSYPWKEIPFESNPDLSKYRSFRQASHALLFSKTTKCLFGYSPMQHSVMMQLRHDGMFGFPGGFVDRHEDIVAGLNRELMEEIGLDKKAYLLKEDYLGAWIHRDLSLIDHFFVKKYPEKEFVEIEKMATKSEEWGKETLGIVRVPIQDPKSFSNFLRHNFIENARDQLVKGLLDRSVISLDDVNCAWQLTQQSQR